MPATLSRHTASHALFVAQSRLANALGAQRHGKGPLPTADAPAPTAHEPAARRQRTKAAAVPVDYSALFDRSQALFDTLVARHDQLNRMTPEQNAAYRMAQGGRMPGDIVYQQILEDLRGFRTSRGKPLVLTDIQMEVAMLVINSFLPLIYEEEYDRNPEGIRARYSAHVHAIMAMLMPRKFGKTTLLSAVYAVLLMNIPGFVGTNVSVTKDQARLLLDMLDPMVRYHVRAKDFSIRVSKETIVLVDGVGDVRRAEIRASRVRFSATAEEWRQHRPRVCFLFVVVYFSL